MDRRSFLSLLASMPVIGAAGWAEANERTLKSASNYFNRIDAAKGRFTQFNANGSRTTGNYFLDRPGRFRFEYDKSKALVMSDGSRVAVFDHRSNTGPEIYPLRTTPLRLLVQKKVDLTKPGVAKGVSNDGTFTRVTLQDPKRPRSGTITLVFRNVPPTLVQWEVKERSGKRTKVVLENIDTEAKLSKTLFDIRRAESDRS